MSARERVAGAMSQACSWMARHLYPEPPCLAAKRALHEKVAEEAKRAEADHIERTGQFTRELRDWMAAVMKDEAAAEVLGQALDPAAKPNGAAKARDRAASA